MKKILLIAAVLCATLCIGTYAACTARSLGGKALRGSGASATRSIEAPAFEGIAASRGVVVVIRPDADARIDIEGYENLLDFVVVKSDGKTLKVTMDDNYSKISNMNIRVSVPANVRIRSLVTSSAAGIVCEKALQASDFGIEASSGSRIAVAVRADKCRISASSAANIQAAIDADLCTVDLSSAASAELTGSAASCRVDMSSASKLRAPSFVVADYELDLSSAAKARVHCTEKLNAGASSGSSITYSGDCAASLSSSSGAHIGKD